MEPNEYIRQRRNDLGISLQGLSDRLSRYGYMADRGTIGHWERGRNNPPIEDKRFRIALALALEIDVNELIRQMGLLVTESERSQEARHAAEIIDNMPPDRRAMAIDILERMAAG